MPTNDPDTGLGTKAPRCLFLDAWLRPPRTGSGNPFTSPDSFRLLRVRIKASDRFAVCAALSSFTHVPAFTTGWPLLACDPDSSQLEPGFILNR
jgi:hypothetical protein